MSNNILKRTEMPFVVTMIIGLIAYQFQFFIERSLDTRMLEYSMSSKRIKTNKELEEKQMSYCVAITNISDKLAIDDLKLLLDFSLTAKMNQSARLLNPELETRSPAQPPSSEPEAGTVSGATYTFDVIHPGTKYVLRFETKQAKNSWDKPKIYISSNQPVRLVKSSPVTFFLKYQVVINGIFIGVYLIILIYILRFVLPRTS